MYLSAQNVGLETLKRYNLNVNEHFLLNIIWSYENKNKDCFLSIEKFAKYLNTSTSTIDRTIKGLKSKGFIYCDKQEKKLSSLGSLYCRTVFNYRPYKPKKKGIPLPTWYEDYKKEVTSNNKVNMEEEKTNTQELANELFN